jgi:hypothetical protein
MHRLRHFGLANAAQELFRERRMKIFAQLLTVCALIIGDGYSYATIFPAVYIRYRLTLDVNVDGVTHTGSGVVEIPYSFAPDAFNGLPGGSFYGSNMIGYAITVDLGARGLLFVVDEYPALADPATGKALLPKGANLSQLPLRAFGVLDQGNSKEATEIRHLQHSARSADIPIEELPMLVRFRDINDRRSMGEVDPHDLSSAFGPGVVLTRATLEITNDPVTPMPQSWPKWLLDEQDKGFMLQAYSSYLYHDVSLSTNIFKGQ